MKLKEILQTLVARMTEEGVDFALSGGLALSTMGIFRLTNDLDFLLAQEHVETVHGIMSHMGYELQDFSNEDIRSYTSPLKVFGQVDFLIARRSYTRAMLERAATAPVFHEQIRVKTLQPEDLIGLKVQALHNDPETRWPVDSADIQQILAIHRSSLNMELVREYFRVFDREALLDEWLAHVDRNRYRADAPGR